MKMFVCSVCGHIEFNEAPNRCPVCGVPAEKFTEKTDALKKPADPRNLTEGDKKHIPVINVVKTCGFIPGGECVDVHIKVGEIIHVMEEKHYIVWLDFYIDRKFAGRVHFTPGAVNPATAFHLKVKAGTLSVIENCNIHGNWMTETNL
ncbi:MAG: desulfoferrodoxin family protein [Planctomycetota bacterium]